MTEKNLAERIDKCVDDILTTRIAIAALSSTLSTEQRSAFIAAFRAQILALDDSMLFLPIPDQLPDRLARSAATFEALFQEWESPAGDAG